MFCRHFHFLKSTKLSLVGRNPVDFLTRESKFRVILCKSGKIISENVNYILNDENKNSSFFHIFLKNLLHMEKKGSIMNIGENSNISVIPIKFLA